MIRDLFHVEREHLNVRLAAGALVAILIGEVLVTVLGVGLVQTGLAAFLVLASARSGDPRTRLTRMGIVTLIGGAFGFLGYLSADTAWQAAVVLGVVAYLTGLAYGYGSAAGSAGFFLLVWALAIQIGTAEGTDPPGSAAAFLVGGIIAIVVMGVLIALRLVSDAPEPDAAATERQAAPSVTQVATSPVGIWSLVRAVLVAVAVVLGYQISPNFDPYWVAIVVLVVFLPASDKTTFKATQRGIGTLAGAVAATTLLTVTTSEPVVAVALLVAAFFTAAFYSANYLIYAFFLTSGIVFYEWFAAGEQLGAGGERLLAAVVGLVLAFAGIGLVAIISSPRSVERPARAD
jgi:fusaric acid resistance family protein